MSIRTHLSALLVALLLFGAVGSAWAQNPFLQNDRKRTIVSVEYFGNMVTQDYILDRVVRIQPGDEYDPLVVSDAWERLEDLAIIAYVDIQEKRPTPTEIHLAIYVEEDVRFLLTPNILYERRHDGFLLGFDARYRNVRGRDETIDFSATWWKRHGYDLRWSNPHILGSAKLGVYLAGRWHRYDFRFEPFRLTDFGARAGVWRQFGPWVTADVQYDHRQLRADDSEVDGVGGTVHDPAFQAGLRFDSRDLTYYPSRGILADATARFAGVGRETTYTILEGSLAGYYGIPYLEILAGRVAMRTSEDPLPLYERTYLGGPSNLRGVDFGSVEGDRSWLASLEWRYPLFLLPLRDGKAVGIGLHAFHDWGKAWEVDASFDDAPLRWSWGLGAHFNFNTRNLRLEWARTDDGDNVLVFEDRMTF